MVPFKVAAGPNGDRIGGQRQALLPAGDLRES